MPRTKKTLLEKMQPVFNKYSQIMPDLINVDTSKFYPVNYWSPLKLYCLASYIHSCYVKIIPSQITDNYYFIDLMANSGINKIDICEKCGDKGTSHCRKCKHRNREKINMVGSTLIAASAIPAFKKIYFIDMDPSNIEVLSKRLEILRNNGFPDVKCIGISGDCNEHVPRILDEIKSTQKEFGRYHLLAFVDNEGLNVKWATICNLLNCFSDLIINFPTSNLRRAATQPREWRAEELDSFMGLKDVKKIVPEYTNLMELYISRIKEIRKDAEVIPIKINTNMGFYYTILIVVKKGEYMGFMTALKEEVEKNSASTIEALLPIIKGEQRTLTSFD